MSLFPSVSSLKASFSNQFFVSSSIDDAKAKAVEVKDAALDKASEVKDKAVAFEKKAEAEIAKGVQALAPKKQIPLYSAEFYGYCTLGGILGMLLIEFLEKL